MGSFSMGSLIASFAISSVGLVLTTYGKKMARLPQLIVGLVLLVYPYFVPAVVPMVIVAGGLVGAMLLALRAGY
jgi:predicted cobalt transporter CbtA